MEEYEPITKELRCYVSEHATSYETPGGVKAYTFASLDADYVGRLCDNIDAVHKRLEDLCECTKDELHALRETDKFVDRVHLAVDNREDLTLWGVGYMALPLDADGVSIHVGDVMDTSSFGTVEVEGFTHGAIAFYSCEDSQARLCTSPAKLCHHHAPTVEDVLQEFALSVCKDEALTIRKGVVEEFAAKLREVMANE